MNAIDRATTIRRAAHQVSCTLNDEVAILSLRSTLYFGLDEVGACVWQALEEPNRVDALCKAVASHFEVSEAACEADVLVCLRGTRRGRPDRNHGGIRQWVRTTCSARSPAHGPMRSAPSRSCAAASAGLNCCSSPRARALRPHLMEALRDSSWNDVPADAKAALEAFRLFHLTRVLFLTDELCRIADAFAREGLRFATFKGLALAALHHGSQPLREFDDIDLIVPPARIAEAEQLLRSLGYRGTDGETAFRDTFFGYQRQYGFVRTEPDVSVDLHWAFTSASLPFPLDPAEIWADLQPISLGGRAIPTLSGADLALLLAGHGTKEGWRRLGWVCDFATCLDRNPSLDWSAIFQRARRRGCGNAVLLAQRWPRALLGTAVPPALVPFLSAERPRARARPSDQPHLRDRCSGDDPATRSGRSRPLRCLEPKGGRHPGHGLHPHRRRLRSHEAAATAVAPLSPGRGLSGSRSRRCPAPGARPWPSPDGEPASSSRDAGLIGLDEAPPGRKLDADGVFLEGVAEEIARGFLLGGEIVDLQLDVVAVGIAVIQRCRRTVIDRPIGQDAFRLQATIGRQKLPAASCSCRRDEQDPNSPHRPRADRAHSRSPLDGCSSS